MHSCCTENKKGKKEKKIIEEMHRQKRAKKDLNWK